MSNSNRGMQLLNFYLRKWKYFDVNIAYLSDVEKIQMKILYASLKSLSEGEIKFLSEKYRLIEVKPLNNSDAAKLRGIPTHMYERESEVIEMKLISCFLENENYFKAKLKEAVQLDAKRRRGNKRFKSNFGSENC